MRSLIGTLVVIYVANYLGLSNVLLVASLLVLAIGVSFKIIAKEHALAEQTKEQRAKRHQANNERQNQK